MSGTVGAVLDEVLGGGRILVLRDEAGVREGWQRIHEETLTAVGEVAGAAARDRVASDGLGVLHEVIAPLEIGALRDAVMPRVRQTLFDVTCRVAREVLGIEGTFYVDDYTILRVNLPYEVALEAPREAENPGIGRMAESARAEARKAKVVDPVYDPKGYHRDQPPAAWAHGPHLDTWTGHSRDGVNLWWAIGDVLAENSMFFYPELFGTPLTPDPRSLYLAEGRPLPPPTPMPLAAGELLVFNPEILHGTHLNVSGRTRVAASTRINARVPEFDPTCFYAREFWHPSDALDDGDLETVIRFERADHLAAPPVAPGPEDGPPSVPTVAAEVVADGAWRPVASSDALPVGGKLMIDGDPGWLLCRTSTGIRAFGARCPHVGACLADGAHDDEHITCPAHVVSYRLDDGTSASPLLRLDMAEARESDGVIELRVSAPAVP